MTWPFLNSFLEIGYACSSPVASETASRPLIASLQLPLLGSGFRPALGSSKPLLLPSLFAGRRALLICSFQDSATTTLNPFRMVWSYNGDDGHYPKANPSLRIGRAKRWESGVDVSGTPIHQPAFSQENDFFCFSLLAGWLPTQYLRFWPPLEFIRSLGRLCYPWMLSARKQSLSDYQSSSRSLFQRFVFCGGLLGLWLPCWWRPSPNQSSYKKALSSSLQSSPDLAVTEAEAAFLTFKALPSLLKYLPFTMRQ